MIVVWKGEKPKNITIRKAAFAHGKEVDLSGNLPLFNKVKNIPGFEIVDDGEGQEE